jgi:hypothetical protein
VVARTPGAGRKYFYRRRESGSWTPWQHIKLDIEDNPVLPIVWNGRLLLFWVRILKEVPLETPPAPNDDRPLTEVTRAALLPTSAPRLTIKAILCWSEHYNGKWQATRTSDLGDPALLGKRSEVQRSRVAMHAIESSEGLRIFVWDSEIASFVLYNTHSSPIKVPTTSTEWSVLWFTQPYRLLHTYGDPRMVASYTTPSAGADPDQNFARLILTNVGDDDGSDYTVEPKHLLADTWGAPFQYADGRHVFYVTTRRTQSKLHSWVGYVPWFSATAGAQIPSTVSPSTWETQLQDGDAAKLGGLGHQQARITRFLASNQPVLLGETLIGPAGSLSFGTNQQRD